MFVSFAFLFTNNANASHKIDWYKSNRGIFGYNTVSQKEKGVSADGRDTYWEMRCTDPGLSGCRFIAPIRPSDNNGTLSDFELGIAAQFFDDMNNDIDEDAVNNTSGVWTKTIETQFRNRTVRIYITSDWQIDRNGAMRVRTIIDSAYI
jgi:hypothetical protein